MTTITRLFDFPHYQLEHYNIPDALVTKHNGVWIKTSTEEYLPKQMPFREVYCEWGFKRR